MRTARRTPDRGLLRDAAALGVAMIAIAASFGAIAIASGLPWWAPSLMSVIVFAGGAQFMAVGLLAAGNPVAAVFAGLLLNARHLPFGLAVGEAIGPRLRHRLVGSHIMTDEAVAFALKEPDPQRRHRTFWLVSVMLFCTWNVGTVLGVLFGSVTGDPETYGLDAAFPAGLIALILPTLRDRDTRNVALAGALVAVLATPLLPTGLPILLSLAGLGVLLLRRRPRPGGGTPEPASAQVRSER
jgi:4-azaleucine resistance transporter AzlC